MAEPGRPSIVDLTIVIPAFNEEQRLANCLRAVHDFAQRVGRVEVIFVNDGSTDRTLMRLEAAQSNATADHRVELRVLWHKERRGKGAAVRTGLLAARAEWILVADADLSTPLEAVHRLGWEPSAGRLPDCDVLIGSRDVPGAELGARQPPFRRMAARALRGLRRLLVLPDVLDTQCGFKLWRGAAAGDVFSRTRIDGWMFDVEALAIAVRLGYRIREVGVPWSHHPDSRVRSVPDGVRAAFDLLRIVARVRFGSFR